MSDRQYKPGEFAKLTGVDSQTLRAWDKSGKLKAGRKPGGKQAGHRYYTEAHLLQVQGDSKESTIARISRLEAKLAGAIARISRLEAKLAGAIDDP